MFPGRSGRTTPRCSILNFCGVKYVRLSGFKISIGCHLSGFLGARGKDDRKSGPSLPVAGDTALLQVEPVILPLRLPFLPHLLVPW